MAKMNAKNLRTWIEVDSRAAKRNYDTFRKLIGRNVKLWSVVKSNAYGHGLVVFANLAQKLGVDGFCVDSLVEGIRLRKEGIKKPILVLGPTLPALFPEAAKRKITLTISNFDALKALMGIVAKKATTVAKKATVSGGIPEFHIKVDTGMHRQGFYTAELPKAIRLISNYQFLIFKQLKGIYTHFASAKDINYPTYTEKQFGEFQKAVKLFEEAGFPNLTKHCAATGATLIYPKYHLDAVRVGIGLYGLWPSKELEMQLPKIKLHPVLSWRGLVSEVKPLAAGDFIGYDLVERASRPTKIAILPVGYWHGFPRTFSGIGEVLINGKRARVLGRVSMDLLAVDAGGTGAKVGDIVTLIGKDGGDEIKAFDAAAKAGTIHYELLTRLNPLIERVLI